LELDHFTPSAQLAWMAGHIPEAKHSSSSSSLQSSIDALGYDSRELRVQLIDLLKFLRTSWASTNRTAQNCIELLNPENDDPRFLITQMENLLRLSRASNSIIEKIEHHVETVYPSPSANN
jgi:hypothetical protein